jgi:hypothetical protein
MLTRIQAPDVQRGHRSVHIILSGETDRLPLPRLQVRADVKGHALNRTSVGLKHLAVGSRLVYMDSFNRTSGD